MATWKKKDAGAIEWKCWPIACSFKIWIGDWLWPFASKRIRSLFKKRVQKLKKKLLLFYSKNGHFGGPADEKRAIVKTVNKIGWNCRTWGQIYQNTGWQDSSACKVDSYVVQTSNKEDHAVIAVGEAGNSEGAQHHMSLQSLTLEWVSHDTVATAEVSIVIGWWVLTVFIICGSL